MIFISNYKDFKKLDLHFSFSFKVNYVIYRNTASLYSVILCTPNLPSELSEHLNGNTVVVTGLFFDVQKDDIFDGVGKWENTKRGWQISLIEAKFRIPDNAKGLASYLIKYCPGVGSKTVNKLIDAYGLSLLDKIKENVENVTCLGISKKRAESIYNFVTTQSEVEEFSLFLMRNGILNFKKIVELYNYLKPGALNKIIGNPYCLCMYFGLSAFSIADHIASENCKSYSDIRLKNGLYYFIVNSIEQYGHIFLPEKYILSNANLFIQRYSKSNINYSECEIIDALIFLSETNQIIIDFDSEYGNCIYLPSYFAAEQNSATIITKRLNSGMSIGKNIHVFEFLKKYEAKNNISLAEEQKNAIHCSSLNRMMILTGGPGVGKTSTINAIIQYHRYLNPNIQILLAAPTGRAAKRITQLTEMPAFTVHRLLGIQENSNSSEGITLNCDLLIVDEFSMIDIFLFYKILKAIDGTSIKLIFVGDHNQLPSVGPGLVLKNLIDSKIIPTIRLTTVFRQKKESQIVENAYKILNNNDISKLMFNSYKSDFYFICQNSNDGIIKKISESIYYLSQKYFSLDEIIVLTPMKKGLLGSVHLNQILQNIFNPMNDNDVVCKTNSYTFRLNDRVMQQKNNYQLVSQKGTLGVFNGEVGTIQNIYTLNNSTAIDVKFDTDIYTYKDENIEELELAYSITIHKAQGSEFPCVLMPFSEALSNTDRNILYTSITRAKKMFTAVGSKKFFNYAIQHDLSVSRYSRLEKKIINSITTQ